MSDASFTQTYDPKKMNDEQRKLYYRANYYRYKYLWVNQYMFKQECLKLARLYEAMNDLPIADLPKRGRPRKVVTTAVPSCKDEQQYVVPTAMKLTMLLDQTNDPVEKKR